MTEVVHGSIARHVVRVPRLALNGAAPILTSPTTIAIHRVNEHIFPGRTPRPSGFVKPWSRQRNDSFPCAGVPGPCTGNAPPARLPSFLHDPEILDKVAIDAFLCACTSRSNS